MLEYIIQNNPYNIDCNSKLYKVRYSENNRNDKNFLHFSHRLKRFIKNRNEDILFNDITENKHDCVGEICYNDYDISLFMKYIGILYLKFNNNNITMNADHI